MRFFVLLACCMQEWNAMRYAQLQEDTNRGTRCWRKESVFSLPHSGHAADRAGVGCSRAGRNRCFATRPACIPTFRSIQVASSHRSLKSASTQTFLANLQIDCRSRLQNSQSVRDSVGSRYQAGPSHSLFVFLCSFSIYNWFELVMILLFVCRWQPVPTSEIEAVFGSSSDVFTAEIDTDFALDMTSV